MGTCYCMNEVLFELTGWDLLWMAAVWCTMTLLLAIYKDWRGGWKR